MGEERRVDVRVHFLPFHSKVSVRRRGHVWQPRRPLELHIVQTLTVCGMVSPYTYYSTVQACILNLVSPEVERLLRITRITETLRFPVVVSPVRLSQHI